MPIGRGANILVVDDSEDQRYLTSRILRMAGYEVKEAVNGKEGLEKAKDLPDLIVLDIKLPDIDGFEVCRQIKSDPITSQIIVLFASGAYLESQFKVKGLEGGAEGYLTLPVEPPVLLATVRSLLRLKQAEKELRESHEKMKQLETVINHSEVIVLIRRADEGWPVEFISDNISHFGYRAEDFISGRLPYANIVYANDIERVISESSRYSQQGNEQFDLQYQIVTKSGSIRWVHDRTLVRRNLNGLITHYQSILDDITERKGEEEEREKLIYELNKALSNVKRLSGLIPICSSCKRIRDDKGYWNQIDSYIRDHSEAEFSHGICPECMKKLYPDFYEEVEEAK